MQLSSGCRHAFTIFALGNISASSPTIEKLWGIQVQGFEDDTLILHHDLYPDEAHDLAHVTFSFTDAPVQQKLGVFREAA